MHPLDWEFVVSAVATGAFAVTDVGPLHGPITKFNIRRNQGLHLVIETSSPSGSTSNAVPGKLGRVWISEEEVRFAAVYGGVSAVARGVIPRSAEKSLVDSESAEGTHETATAHSVRWQRESADSPVYLIEWIENMPTHFIWPDTEQVERSQSVTRTLSSSKGSVILSRADGSGSGSHRSCAHLIFGEVEIFVGIARVTPDNVLKPGFILYKGVHSEEERRKIRDCLSFCLGTYLIYLGNTAFDLAWQPVSAEVFSAHALVSEASRLTGLQPMPLGDKWQYQIDDKRLTPLLASLCQKYDQFNLKHVFWGYWHALAAPVHMTAVHFGAIIESLQKAVFAANESKGHRKIVSDDIAWQPVLKALLSVIAASELSGQEKDLLERKAPSLNQASQTDVADRLFGILELKIGTVEKSVWKNRNRAAHGGSGGDEDGVRLIRSNKVLAVMIHRMLLAISGSASQYYDYYTLDHPIRYLKEPIPDDQFAELPPGSQ
jgi:hypothetical protein